MFNALCAPSRSRSHLLVFIALCLSGLVLASTNFNQCLASVQSGAFGPNAGVDNLGRPVPYQNATAVPYDVCLSACGNGPEAFSWSSFSNQFSAWLLPWLALLSQLPFGANDNLENLISVVLAVGSPVLAAYSAALTVLNGRWIARRFSGSTYPNTYYAVRVLSSLQQAPIALDLKREALLASLVVLPENDDWWRELLEHLNYTYTWSISAAASIAWVLIAYIFTVIDGLSDTNAETIEVNGQGVGSIWLWLLPVVIAWLQISPKCDSIRIRKALGYANDIAYVATPNGTPKRAGIMSDHRAIFLNETDDALYSDQRCSSPIYNYSRLFSWTAAVEDISDYFHEATRQSRQFIPVASDSPWVHEPRNCTVRDENRVGTSAEVVAYCTSLFPRGSRWGSGVWGRIIIASVLALLLQWGTAGAAIFVQWETPTRGLGCRSGSYFLYALVSTIVWALLVFANILSHYSTFDFDAYDIRETTKHYARVDLAGSLSIAIRRFAKILAAGNAVWILTACMFQFSSFYDRCYCNSSALGLGAKAYNVIAFTSDDISSMRAAWIGGVVLAIGSAAIFVGFINVFIDPPLPCSPNRD